MKNKNQFFSHFLSIGLGTIINMLLGLLSTPIITRIVDPNEYGQLSVFNTYSSIALLVLCVGLDQSLIRFFYEKEDLDYKVALFKFCFLIPILISSIASIVIYITSVAFGGVLKFDSIIILFLCLNVIFSIWNRMSLLLLRLSYKSKTYAICNVLHRLLYLLLAIILVYTIKDHYLLLLVIATVSSLIVPSIVASFSTSEYWNLTVKNKLTNKKEIIIYGLPFILSMGITTIFQSCDVLALEYFCSYSEVGIYSSAMTLVSVFAIIQTTFNAVWSPMMIEQITKNPEDKTLIKKANKYMTIIMFGFGLCLIFGKDLFALLLGEKYREAASILPFLIFNPIMYTISETTQAGIEYSKKSYFNIIVAAIACIANLVGNIFLVPRFGCKGAAISTGCSYIIFFIMRTFISDRFYKVSYQIWKFAIITIITMAYAFYNTFYSFNWISIVGFFVSIIMLMVLYFKDIKQLLGYIINQIKTIFSKKGNNDE